MTIKKWSFFLALYFLIVSILVYSLGIFNHYYYSIPIELNSYNIPCTVIEIEGEKYQVEIDLGSKTALTLPKEILEKIKKVPNGISRRIDYLGNKYETPSYIISNVKAGPLFIKEPRAKEESLLYVMQTVIEDKKTEEAEEEKYLGRIGRDFFLNKNLFIDLGNNQFILSSSLKNLKKNKKMISIPFTITKEGIIFDIELDLGTKKFILDTGSTLTILRDSQANKLAKMETTKFSLGNNDFGPTSLYRLNLSPLLENIDGLIGVDFFKKHAIYLDFTKKIAHIEKNTN